MRNSICLFTMALTLLGPTLNALAGQTSKLVATRSAASAAVTLGKWHANFKKCKDYATKNKVPLIAVWSNGDNCGHCVAFESSCNSAYFKNWMKTSGCVFYFIYSGDGGDGAVGSSVFHWIRKDKNTAYPFVRIYWPAGKVDVATVGDTVDGNKDGTKGGKKAVAYFKNKLKKYKPNPQPVVPKYKGGSFNAGDGELNCLEAEVGNTTQVLVTLSRTNTVASAAYTNSVVVTYPDGVCETNVLAWAEDEAATNLSVAVRGEVGEKISLTLLDDRAACVASNYIALVNEPENSPKNPRWIGERTVDTLAWGEWTMDIDAATNKVAAYNQSKAPVAKGMLKAAAEPQKAYTLLLVGGPLWCPDCKRAEDSLFNTPAFRAWATNENRIACVAIDEPKFGGGYLDCPTLLTEKSLYVSNIVAVGQVSGAGYLSRKMADPDVAADVLARNLRYVNEDTLHGGFCTPDNTTGAGNTGKWRTGVPCVIVLREDGTVAGRLFQFSNSTSALADGSATADVMVERLREILAQDADASEELNDDRQTTANVLTQQDRVDDSTLSFSDVVDFYRLDPETTAGSRIKASLVPVSGKADFLPGTRLSVKIVQASGSSTKVLAESEGVFSVEEPLACAAEIPLSNCFVAVSYPMDANAYSLDPQFALTNGQSTLCHYTLETDFVAVPTQTNRTVTVTGGFVLAISSNQVYRLTGIDAAANVDVLESVPDMSDCYKALATGDIEIALAGTQVSYQIWMPGEVGFARASGSVAEPQTVDKDVYNLVVARTGGVSGRATIHLEFDAAKSSKLDGLYSLSADFGKTLVWEEGESAEQIVPIEILNNAFADGDQTLYFRAVKESDSVAAEGVMEFKLTIRDNDKKVPGRLAIVSSEPAMASSMTVFQRVGGEVKVDVGRVEGSTGGLGGSLAASRGELDQTAFAWANRETETQTAVWSLTGATAGQKLVATLTPDKGTAVDAARRKLTVNVLAADVPGFAEAKRVVEATRYVPIAEQVVALDDKAAAGAKIKKYSGTLAPGLSWKQVDDTLVVSGVPNKAGSYTAVFRVSNGSKAGLTLSFVVDVVDPVLAGGGETGTAPLNASVAKTRTFTDVPVYESATNRLAGLLTLTLPRTGRASAKFRRADKTLTLSTPNWSAVDADGNLTAVLTDAQNTASLQVVVAPDGGLTLTLTDAAFADGLTCDFAGVVWSAAAPATDFKGYYTVSIPCQKVVSGTAFATGAGYVTLKMNTTDAIRAGKFAYAGVYANGKPFSGSAVLTPKSFNADFGYWEYAVLPLLVTGTADSLAGGLRLTPGAADPAAADVNVKTQTCEGRCSYQNIRRSVHPSAEAELVWRHAGVEAEACEEVLDVYGTYYVSTESFADCCQRVLGTTQLSFFALGGINALSEEALEEAQIDLRTGFADWVGDKAVTKVKVSFAKATKKAKTQTNQIVSTNTKTLALTFTPGTGLVKGTFKMPFEGTSVTMTYQGIVMPGWGSQECADCGMGGAEAQLRPFISGTAYFNDTLDYEDAKGRDRSATIRRSCAFSVGLKAGE